MKVKVNELIGIANPKTAVKAYRKSPGNFNLAANAAAHYAKLNGEDMIIIPGNSYGAKVFHIAKATESLTRFVGGIGSKFVSGAVVKTDGAVYNAELTV